MTVPDQMMCETCGRPLSFFVHADGASGWAHADQAISGTEDHLPMPVPPSEEAMQANCDLCFTPAGAGEWTMECKPFVIEIGGMGQDMSSLWLVCRGCKDLLDADDWVGVGRRCIALHEQRHPSRNENEASVRAEFHRLLAHLIKANFIEIRKADFEQDMATDTLHSDG